MEGINMENYIVINGVRHDLKKQKGVSCQDCSLFGHCSHTNMPCEIFAGNDWYAILDYYFVLHSNS